MIFFPLINLEKWIDLLENGANDLEEISKKFPIKENLTMRNLRIHYNKEGKICYEIQDFEGEEKIITDTNYFQREL